MFVGVQKSRRIRAWKHCGEGGGKLVGVLTDAVGAGATDSGGRIASGWGKSSLKCLGRQRNRRGRHSANDKFPS
jgi:hypothetical protein